MRGKILNSFMALLNILVGIVLIIFSIKIPQDITELTVQEIEIVKILKIVLYIVLGFTTALNIMQYFYNSQNSTRRTGYLISFFTIIFILMKHYILGAFGIVGGIVILYGNFKEQWVELNSVAMISVIGIVIVVTLILTGMCFVYKNIGAYIIKKQNENEIAYKEDYFRYVTELGIDEPYINIKKDGKYGYINTNGEIKIDFKYDYASPFVKVSFFNKNFQVAMVCFDGSTQIILKNERVVMSYRTESVNSNYEAKMTELKDIYKNTFKQSGEMKFEVEEKDNSITKIPAIKETSEEYTYRYDYNETYDILVTQSSMGFGDIYELAKKDDLSFKIKLECENLDYDEDYLYLFSNGYIPYYARSIRKQGWITGSLITETLRGDGQIIEFINDTILLKDHNKDTFYFIKNDNNINIISPSYKEIFICDNDRFIVKKSNNKYVVINSNYEKVISEEWDFVDLSLVSEGIYIFGNTNGVIDFNDYNYASNMKLKIYNRDGYLLSDNVEQVYSKYYSISSDEKTKYADRYSSFLNSLKKMNVKYVGDKFYK